MAMNWIQRIGILAILALLSAPATFGETTEPNPAIQAVAESANTFALNLYGQLSSREGNLFFSPYSIDDALMMVRAGAGGATADQISATLKLPDLKNGDLNAAMAELSGRFDSNVADKGYELHVANAMWGQAGASFVPAYLDELQKDFAAELNGINFHNPQAAATTINEWVAKKTNDRIKDLISPGALNDRTKLLLTNAIYFKGDWREPFKTQATHDAPWNDGTLHDANSTAGSQDKVPMMFQAGDFYFVKDDGLSALQMPYRGDELAMLILLPDDPAGLGELEKTLDAARLKEIVGKMGHQHRVEVSFPKFKLETAYELSHTLAEMGMPTAFSNEADLSGIDGKRDLSITGVVHKAFVQLDETGTEAAAATGVMVGAMAMRQRTVFNADHPFVFVIRDVKTGTILFIGRVIHPAT